MKFQTRKGATIDVASSNQSHLLEDKNSRWCAECGEPISLNTSEIYEPDAVNPNPPPFYFELCQNCAMARRQ